MPFPANILIDPSHHSILLSLITSNRLEPTTQLDALSPLSIFPPIFKIFLSFTLPLPKITVLAPGTPSRYLEPYTIVQQLLHLLGGSKWGAGEGSVDFKRTGRLIWASIHRRPTCSPEGNTSNQPILSQSNVIVPEPGGQAKLSQDQSEVVRMNPRSLGRGWRKARSLKV